MRAVAATAGRPASPDRCACGRFTAAYATRYGHVCAVCPACSAVMPWRAIACPGCEPAHLSRVVELSPLPSPDQFPDTIIQCAVCLSILAAGITDCETCKAAGVGVLDAPAPDLESPAAELERLEAAAAPGPRVLKDAPFDDSKEFEELRIIEVEPPPPPAPRVELPPPPPPLRAYTHSETCGSCGRLPELHQELGGPLEHPFQPIARAPEGL